jgi:hypothetical protein
MILVRPSLFFSFNFSSPNPNPNPNPQLFENKRTGQIEILININIEVSQMFKNTYQSGFLSILYSIGSKPLQIWDKQSTTTPIQFITDTSSD